MNTKTLGLIGILTSPFLAVDFIVNSVLQEYHPNSLTGIFSLVYMTGWLGCIIALYNNYASGYKRSGRIILIIQICMLILAEGWNIYTIIDPGASTILYHVLDAFWPISNSFMNITGLFIIKANVLKGWKRYVSFIAGLWLPVSFLLIAIIGKNSIAAILSSSIYSAIAWFLLGLCVYLSSNSRQPFKKVSRYTYKAI
jgi:hypothetical protein